MEIYVDKNAGNRHAGAVIYNCYNTGEISVDKNQNSTVGGIIGCVAWKKIDVINCYNVGKLVGKSIGGIIGNGNISSELLNVQNTYFLDTTATVGMNGLTIEAESRTEQNLKSLEFINELNANIDAITDIDISNWKKWQEVANNYPTFE